MDPLRSESFEYLTVNEIRVRRRSEPAEIAAIVSGHTERDAAERADVEKTIVEK